MDDDRTSDMEPLTAAIFNTLHGGPGAQDISTFQDMQCEHPGDGEVQREWRGIKAGLEALPPNVARGLLGLLQDSCKVKGA
jgi:hypothetical protein